MTGNELLWRAFIAVFLAGVAPAQGAGIASCTENKPLTFGQIVEVSQLAGAMPAACMRQVNIEVADNETGSFVETQCGERIELEHVNFYEGARGFSAQLVARASKAVAVLRMAGDLDARFPPPRAKPGNWAGKALCSGTLIARDLMLTAAHCFDRAPRNGVKMPMRLKSTGFRTVSHREIATNMVAVFGYELNDTCGCGTERAFPVRELVKRRDIEFDDRTISKDDFAVIRLGPDASGRLPGDVAGIGMLGLADNAPEQGDPIAIVQHPRGKMKRVGLGRIDEKSGHALHYRQLDTFGGTSGAPILDTTGRIAGIHTNGGCQLRDKNTKKPSSNAGITVATFGDEVARILEEAQ